MADLPQEAQFVVAREDAIYCYNADGKGPCFPVSGKKMLVQWLKTFLVVVAKEVITQVSADGPGFKEG